MYQSLPMRRTYAGTNHAHQPPGTLDGEVIFALQKVTKRRAADELHHNKGWNIAVIGLAEVMNGNDVGVMSDRGGARLSAKPAAGVVVRSEFSQQDLYRHFIPDMNATSTIDDAHATFSNAAN